MDKILKMGLSNAGRSSCIAGARNLLAFMKAAHVRENLPLHVVEPNMPKQVV